eukprot:362772-Chlamydomonas_euryale.AAC.9
MLPGNEVVQVPWGLGVGCRCECLPHFDPAAPVAITVPPAAGIQPLTMSDNDPSSAMEPDAMALGAAGEGEAMDVDSLSPDAKLAEQYKSRPAVDLLPGLPLSPLVNTARLPADAKVCASALVVHGDAGGGAAGRREEDVGVLPCCAREAHKHAAAKRADGVG